jgi:hypothetical protein
VQLRGTALDWWDNLSDPQRQGFDWNAFELAVRARFQPVNSGDTARAQLDALRQGPKQSVHDYIAAFRRPLPALPEMHEKDRVHCFLAGLLPELRGQLKIAGVTTLADAIEKASRIGSHLQMAAAGSAAPHRDGNAMDVNALGLYAATVTEGHDYPTDDEDAAAPVSRAEFKQLLAAMQHQRDGSGSGGSNRGGKRPPFGRGDRRPPPRVHGLSEQEVRKRLDERLCFVCGEAGHRKYDCPENKEKSKN